MATDKMPVTALVGHLRSVSLGFGATGRADLKTEMEITSLRLTTALGQVARREDMASAPHDGTHVLPLLGETIPDVPDWRIGSFIPGSECVVLGWSSLMGTGGWMGWNSADDWFVIPLDKPKAWARLPQ